MLNLTLQALPLMQAAPAPGGGMGSIIIFLPLILIFYFLLFRPQQQRVKKHTAMLGSIVRNDTIVTNGGIVGKVTKVDDTELTVQIAEGLKVKVMRSMIADVRRIEPANDTKAPSKSAKK